VKFFGDLIPLGDPAAFAAHLRPLRQIDWVVYAKRPFGGPQQVLDYLGRYTHRAAIANSRIIGIDDTHVRFRWKDYRQPDKPKVMTLDVDEFIRRFLLHVLPVGFRRIAHSADRERSNRSIMNTGSGDHERALVANRRTAPSSKPLGWSDATDGCLVSLLPGVRQAFACCVDFSGVAFAHAGTFEFEPMGAMDDAVQDRVTDCVVANNFVPSADWNLAGDEQRALLIPVIDDLQQIASLLGGKRLRSPVVDDQQACALQRGHET